MGEEWVLQYDNNLKHKSKLASDFLIENNIISLEWPPHLPDLNPIENIWALWHQKLMHKIFRTHLHLIEAVEKAWNNIDDKTIENWVDSMQGKLIECIKRDVERINYKFIL